MLSTSRLECAAKDGLSDRKPTYSKSESDSDQDVMAPASASRQRTVLTREQARDIFKLKCEHGYQSLHSASVQLARRYRVSSKAIRDIWKGRSWLEATFDLWSDQDRPERKTIGRPKGKKDTKQRIRNNSKTFHAEQIEKNKNFQIKALNLDIPFEDGQTQRNDRLPSISAMLYGHSDSNFSPVPGFHGNRFTLPVPLELPAHHLSCLPASFARNTLLDLCAAPLGPASFSAQIDYLAAALLHAHCLPVDSNRAGWPAPLVPPLQDSSLQRKS
jgi:hypothetical protein